MAWTVSITLLSASFLNGCVPASDDYGFRISDVRIAPGHQKITASVQQDLSLSREANTALENGVTLTLMLEMELRDAVNLTLLADDVRQFEIRYLPLREVFQLTNNQSKEVKDYPRLRHVMNELASLRINFTTGPLAPGSYEYRARITLDNASLPAPMHLPALFSADWKHNSEWSTWPFEINA